MKVVEIKEVGHSIHLQFQNSLSWNENRVKYQNLKSQSSLNALTDSVWRVKILTETKTHTFFRKKMYKTEI